MRHQIIRFVTIAMSMVTIGALCVAHAVALGTLSSIGLASFNSTATPGSPAVITCDGFSLAASTVVRITRLGTAVTVSVNGAQVLAFTLTSGQVTTLSGGTKVGLYWNSGSTIRFSDILATQAFAP